jgi:hypothetical protein
MTRKWRMAITAASGLMTAAAIAIYFLPVPFCRYMCDEFVNAAITQSQGILGGIRFMYSNLTGRYSGITLYNLYSPLGFSAVPWTPVLGLLAFLAALTWMLRRMLPPRSGRLPACLLMSSLFLMVFLQLVPNLFQLLYWPASSINYLLPLVGITLLAGSAIRIVRRGAAPTLHPWRERIGLWLAVLLVAGFTETYAVLMLAALGLGLLASLLRHANRLNRVRLCLGGMAMTILGLLLQIKAPALTVRGDLKVIELGPLAVIIASFKYTGQLFISLLLENLVPLFTMLLAVSFLFSRMGPAAERERFPRKRVLARIGLAALAFILVMAATMTPSFQALGLPPYNRVLTAPVWVFASLWLVVGMLLAPLWPPRGSFRSPGVTKAVGTGLLASAALLGIMATARGSLIQVREYLPGMRRYAQAWDERDRSIRGQVADGKRDAVVNALPATWFILDGGAREAGPNPELWLNQAIAQFYGVDSLVTTAQAARTRPRRKAPRRRQQHTTRPMKDHSPASDFPG